MEYAASVLHTGFIQWETASRRGFLQRMDARVKVLFLLVFVVLISVKQSIHSEAAIAILVLGLTLTSGINPVEHYRKILVLTFIFGFLLALPAAFNIFTPGETVLSLAHFERSHTVWYFTIPQHIGITDEGVRRLALLSLRVMNSLSVCFLVFATTPFMDFVKGLKVLRVPDIFLMTITLSYKYIFIFTTIVHDMHLAKKSRLAGTEKHRGARKWVAGRIAFLYHKSQQRCEEVFRAMLARGLSDSVKHPKMQPLAMRDKFACLGFIAAAIALYWI